MSKLQMMSMDVGEEDMQRRKHEILGLLGGGSLRQTPNGDLRN